MEGFDFEIIGVGNPDHPANEVENEFEDFESNNLNKCLDYAKDNDDFEPLEFAILNQKEITEKVIEELQWIFDSTQNNVSVKNKCIKLINLLKSNQK